MANVLEVGVLRTRVAAGALFLDNRDREWRSRVIKPVHVASTHECILAQLFGRYRDGIKCLGISDAEALAFGFRADSRESGTTQEESRAYYSQLDILWEQQLKK